MARWEHFHHQADIGVRGIGATPAEAFAQAALALTAVVCEPGRIARRDRVEIACEHDALDLLLVDWLNAVVFEMSCRRMLFSAFDVRLDGLRLSAAAWGEPVAPPRHEPAVEVKAASYAEARVALEPGGEWVAQCVVDV